jgi:hypothetical protein
MPFESDLIGLGLVWAVRSHLMATPRGGPTTTFSVPSPFVQPSSFPRNDVLALGEAWFGEHKAYPRLWSPEIDSRRRPLTTARHVAHRTEQGAEAGTHRRWPIQSPLDSIHPSY